MLSIETQVTESIVELQTVIYEVNLIVDVDVVERFDQWLHEHTQEMLAIPGFISAATSVPDVEDENQKHRCVQYRLSDQAALDNYLECHADEMRAKIVQHFDGHFTAKRRVLSVAEAALAAHGVCANCNAELLGRYCNVCGQREEPRVPTIGAISGEFTNELFGVESKLWRSFYLLLFKPGQLTAVYLAGRRQRYMSPVRLYLLFSVVTFACFTLLNSYQGLDVEFGSTQPSLSEVEGVGNNVSEITPPIEIKEFESDLFSDEVNAQILEDINRSIRSIRQDVEAGNKQAVLDKFFEPLPTALFVFLPIVALLFKVLYLGSGRYYVEHLIYVLHNHAFLFAVIIATTVFSQITRVWPPAESLLGLVLFFGFATYAYRPVREFLIEKFFKSKIKAFLYLSLSMALLALLFSLTLEDGTDVYIGLLWSVYVPFYIYRSMRVVYERSRWATTATLMMISSMYLVLLTIMLLSSAVFVGYTYD